MIRRFVDFAQAFDTVSHEHILSSLGQINVDPHVVGLVQETYTNSCTSVEVGGGHTADIQVRVGVKQGDPMSPCFSTWPWIPSSMVSNASVRGTPWQVIR